MRDLVELARQIGTRKGRETFGRFRIDGLRLVERAIRAEIPLEGVVAGKTFANNTAGRERAVLDAVEQHKIPFTVVSDAHIQAILGGRKLGDVVAVAPISITKSLREITTTSQAQLFLGIVDVVEPGNVGAMIRTAHGLGVTAVLTCGVSDPYHPKAVRTAMGSLFRLPLLQFTTAHAMLNSLHDANVATVATVSHDGILLPNFDRGEGTIAILMGNEFEGLSAEITNQTTHRITIPMSTTIDSFSVSAAAAICLYAVGSKQ